MKVILKEDVFKLGSLGDEVEVKPGYARNFLIPQDKALPFTRANVKQISHIKGILAKKRADAIGQAKALAEKLENTEIIFTMKAGENGKLFGSVTQKHIFDALQNQNIDLDRRKLHISVPIKTLGSHIIPIKLHTEVNAKLDVKVIADSTSETATEGDDSGDVEVAAAEAPVVEKAEEPKTESEA
ncbi:50S ribosomal protein L9 [bacterium]|nr:50S ribosomal protein L9 [bacterium]